MTLYFFNLTSDGEQASYLWQDGTLIADRKKGDYSLLLYQLYSFYVEV